jgi:hypothetical protein
MIQRLQVSWHVQFLPLCELLAILFNFIIPRMTLVFDDFPEMLNCQVQ